jgi:Cytochrome c554 and c-prime
MNQGFVIIVAFVLAGLQSTRTMRLFPPIAAQAQSPAPPDAKRNVRSGYVGDDACRSCHADKVNASHQTAHYLTSRMPGEKSILGKFTPGDNLLKTSNPDLFFRMDEKSDGFFQTAVSGQSPNTTSHSERFAVVIGSGGKGQTYLYWREDELFQLPVSYWTNLGWVNSPGYPDGLADFSRPINPRCLECHATYFEALPLAFNRYSTAGFSLGIQCEACHGPGREHVDREQSGRPSSLGSAILNPARFSRDRQLDLCAWCHAGPGQSLLPAFSYRPGEPLDRYIEFPPPDPDTTPDVHGSQVEMLKRSRCFLSSTMTCLTCHDVHRPQHDLAEFSQHCLSCHKPDSATFARADHHVSGNCIDCHMPRQDTDLIVFDWNGRKMRPQVRSHWIKVYSDLKAPAGNG